ncbi:protein REGULATOR OF FATTY ACID COMPOSITION 3, chloroplastic-like [Lathyrus oleraceus]|uniref:protein REGULATOR OF FATTY ACID COMPOSITION 3, chloroplastic-like n=1 Tax=Pisum sativum TaxID=3888 RepID=UPI0021CE512A|nr:protein REGULATOR OF FATTY ACID COMPOSITION 3, chloroplastic-like [Pisum sativum]
MRRFSYKIHKANNAHYILINFKFNVKYINEFKTLLDKDERVIRHLLVKRDEAITENFPPTSEYSTIDDEDKADDEELDDEWDDEDEKEDDFNDDVGVIIRDDDDSRMI